LHSGIYLAQWSWKYGEKPATCYKMATETGGGILFITEGVFLCADNKVN
jgi:hypothetical protein